MQTIPGHLDQSEATGFCANHVVSQLMLGNYRNLVYLIRFPEAARSDRPIRQPSSPHQGSNPPHPVGIVDPHSDLAPLLEVLEKENLEPTWILLTHSHWDHVGGVEKLCDLYPHLRVAVHVLEAHRLSPKLIQKLGDRLHTIRATADQPEKLEPSAPEFEITALHTPGHSAGEICFYLKSAPGRFLFSGDTLFIRDCGNTSQETGDTAAMFETLQRIKHLPPDTVILPGHHYFKGKTAATLAEEVQLSPPLQCRSVAELEALP